MPPEMQIEDIKTEGAHESSDEKDIGEHKEVSPDVDGVEKEEEKEVAEEENKSEESEESEDDKRSYGRPEKRIRSLVKKLSDQGREVQELKTQLNSLNSKSLGAVQQDQEIKEPNLQDFKSWDEFNSASSQFQVKKEVQRVLKEAQHQAATQEWSQRIQAAEANYEKSLNATYANHDDFDETDLEEVTKQLPLELNFIIKESSQPGELLYQLKHSPAVIKDLVGKVKTYPNGTRDLSAAMFELGKISALFESQSKQKPKPKGVIPPQTSSKSVSTTDSDSLDDYFKRTAKRKGLTT